ncbi:replication-associated protein [Enterococcus sp. AZ196]|uniref:replication-associated protein n=1 Tax=Enterococcus sp. AZ196 TaxID=2774659 RepID=UPI003D279713
MESNSKRIGLINKKKKTNTYIPDVKPKNPYTGITETENTPAKPLTEELDFNLLTLERGTIRPPLEQKLELDALVQISDYQYAYELLAELVYSARKQLSKEDEQKYQSVLYDLKRKEVKKIQKKIQKKQRNQG